MIIGDNVGVGDDAFGCRLASDVVVLDVFGEEDGTACEEILVEQED